MGRVVLAFVALIIVLVVVGVAVLGAFPPGPKTEQVERVLPNDRFK